MLLNIIWFRVLFYFVIMIIGIKTLLPYQQQYLQSLQQLKVMKQFRNRIENNKINRHSSQLAIRKTSVHSSTPRDSQSDIQNIRQTTFWMKKTIGAPSGQSCNPQNNKKMIYEGRNRQIFSMKVNTENSETDSTCNQKRGDERDEADENSKLVLIEKSQKQLVQQANILINENLPKLVSCQHLFNSLNKSLKMALKNCSRVLGSQMQRIFDRHIQITTCIFEKVANHTNDFINSQKCAHLISKIMQLEKENSKFMTFCQELQIKLEKQKNNSQTQNNVQIINLRKINIERILSQNYKFGEKQASSLKSQNLCKSLIKPLISVNGNRQVAYFQSTSTVFVQLMSSKQGQFLLRQVWNEQKNKNGVKSNRSISLDKMMLMDILKSAVDFDILALVKSKAHILLHRTKYQTSIKQQKVDMGIVLSILNKLSILKDPIKKKQIIIKLLELLNITQFEGMRKQIETMIDDNFSHIYSSAMRSTTAHNKSVNEQESKASVCDKISRLSQKRFVNCANLYQRKKKKNTRQGQQVSQNHQTGSVKAKFQISLAAEDIVLLSYYFVVWQLEFLSEASLTLTKLNLDEPVDQNMSDKILAPQLSQSIRMNRGREVEKESIFVLANAVSKAYGDQFVVKQQSREQAVRELTSLIKQQILALLSKQKRLVLSELSNQNCQ